MIDTVPKRLNINESRIVILKNNTNIGKIKRKIEGLYEE